MQFLRTLFWVVVAIIAVIFANKNWTTAQVSLWGGIVADVKLPVLLLIAFLAGLLPPTILYHASRWRLRRRLDSAERTIAQLRPVVAPASPVSPTADPVAPFAPIAPSAPSAPEMSMPTSYAPLPNGPSAP